MKFDPYNLPKAFPPDGMIQRHGKPYITHVGLVWLANHRGKPWSGTIVSHDIKWNQDGLPTAAVVLFRVWDDEQEHTDIGDAYPMNVGKMIVPHLIRMASTRAQNRALRAFVGYAGCTADELELGESYDSPQGSGRDQPSNGVRSDSQPIQNSQPASTAGFNIRTNCSAKCPACGAPVWDDRERAIEARKKSGKKTGPPYFKCSRKAACPGGKGDYGWGEFNDPDWLDKQNPDRVINHDRELLTEDGKKRAREMEIDAGAFLHEHCGQDDGPPPYEDSDIPF